MKNIAYMHEASPGSYIELSSKMLYLNKDRILSIKIVLNFLSSISQAENYAPRQFSLKLSQDNDIVLLDKKLEIDILAGTKLEYYIDIPVNNYQTETHLFKLELIGNNYLKIEELETIEPKEFSETYLRLIHNKAGIIHTLSVETNSKNDVYFKYNNANWKKFTSDFVIKNNDLEGKLNYFQLYTLDDKNARIYSNVVRITKND